MKTGQSRIHANGQVHFMAVTQTNNKPLYSGQQAQE